VRSVLLLPFLTMLAASAGAQATGPAPSPAPWLVADSAGRAVDLDLEVTSAAGDASARIAGHREGSVQVVVPLGWTVRWSWHSADATAPHSLVIMAEREKIPVEGGRPAFTNAETRMLVKGLPAGEVDRVSFVADQAGWYWLLCGVPGHALAGEWIGLKVDPDAVLPGVKLK
jgi:Sulfocyanin (SoxE) domain